MKHKWHVFSKMLGRIHQLVMEERAKWFVSPERREWILKTYPPDETGRPGILATTDTQAGSRGKDVGELELVEQEDGSAIWRPKEKS